VLIDMLAVHDERRNAVSYPHKKRKAPTGNEPR